MEHVTPDAVFNRIGVDYAGPIYVKYGYERKPTVVKMYVCVFVSLTVKLGCTLGTGVRLEHRRNYILPEMFHLQMRHS